MSVAFAADVPLTLAPRRRWRQPPLDLSSPQPTVRHRAIRASASSRPLAFAVLAGGCTAALGTEVAAGNVRGVAPGDQARYAAGASTFECFSTGASQSTRGRRSPLPFSAVNDDFCDCADGSDEPGTSACAGQKETLFYCPSERSVAKYVYTSRVNDGVCDCCDGSDEWRRTGACTNTCAAEGADIKRVLNQREADWKSGSATRQRLIEGAKKARAKALEELSQLRASLPDLEVAENAAQSAFEEAEEAYERSKQSNATKDSTPPADDAASAPVDAAATAETETPENAPAATSDAAASTPPAGGAPASGEAADSGGDASSGSVVSEYTKWMDGADKVLDESGGAKAEAESSPPAPDTTDSAEESEEDPDLPDWLKKKPASSEEPAEAEEDSGMFGRLGSWARRTWESIFGKAKSPEERAHDAAKKVRDEARRKVADAKRQVEDLERKTSGDEDEQRLAYSALEDKCILKKLDEYKYEVCFFKSANQDSTSVGTWRHWESDHVGLFDGGQYCPGGPDRSLRVKFECGPKQDGVILDVTEPSRCTYEATLAHPAACVGVSPVEAQGGKTRMPTDEL